MLGVRTISAINTLCIDETISTSGHLSIRYHQFSDIEFLVLLRQLPSDEMGLIALACLFVFGAATSASAEYVRGCYYTSWAQYRPGTGKYTTANYVPGLCTHIFYAFAVMSSDYKIINFDWSDDKGFESLNVLKQQQPGLKTLLSMGGWTFSEQNKGILKGMASTASNRAIFIQSAAQFCRNKNFDGFDIDWEYPESDDKANFASLVTEMRAYFEKEAQQSGKPRLLITAAVSGGISKIDAGYDGRQLGQAFDYVNIMSYDFHGGWDPKTGFNSPLYDRNGDQLSIANAAKHWNEIGVPKEKLLIGMGTYGRGFNLAGSDTSVGAAASGACPAQPFTREAGYAAYYEICDLVEKQGYTESYDNTQQAAYAVKGNQWFGYNNIKSFNAILDFVVQGGYGGAFVWTLDLDDFNGQCKSSNGQKYPLLNAIKTKLGGGGGPKPQPNPQPQPQPQPQPKPQPQPQPQPKPQPQPQPKPQPQPQPKPQPGGSFQCSAAGSFVDPANCNAFYVCLSAGAAPAKMNCGTGLGFNGQVCDWAANVPACKSGK